MIIQLVYNHFATRGECLDMNLLELISFYEQLADEAERVEKEMKKENG